MNRRSLFKLLAAIPFVGSIPWVKARATSWVDTPEVNAALKEWAEAEVDDMMNRMTRLIETNLFTDLPDNGNKLADPVPLTRETLAEAKNNADEFWAKS